MEASDNTENATEWEGTSVTENTGEVGSQQESSGQPVVKDEDSEELHYSVTEIKMENDDPAYYSNVSYSSDVSVKTEPEAMDTGDDGELPKPDLAGERSAECFVASIKNKDCNGTDNCEMRKPDLAEEISAVRFVASIKNEDCNGAETVQPPVPVKIVQNLYSVLDKMKSPAVEQTQIAQTCTNQKIQLAQHDDMGKAQITQPRTVDNMQMAQPGSVEKTQMKQPKNKGVTVLSSSTPVSKPKDNVKKSTPSVFILDVAKKGNTAKKNNKTVILHSGSSDKSVGNATSNASSLQLKRGSSHTVLCGNQNVEKHVNTNAANTQPPDAAQVMNTIQPSAQLPYSSQHDQNIVKFPMKAPQAESCFQTVALNQSKAVKLAMATPATRSSPFVEHSPVSSKLQHSHPSSIGTKDPAITHELHLFPGQVAPSPTKSHDPSNIMFLIPIKQNEKGPSDLHQKNVTHSLPSSLSSNVATSSFVQSQMTNTTTVVPSRLTPTTSVAPFQSGPSSTRKLHLFRGQVMPLLRTYQSRNVATSSFVQSQTTTVVSSQLTPTTSIAPLQTGPSTSSNIAASSYVQSQNTTLSSVVPSPLTLTTSIAPLQISHSTSSNVAASSYVQSQSTTLSSIVTSRFTTTTSVAPLESCQSTSSNDAASSNVQSQNTTLSSVVLSPLTPTTSVAPLQSCPSISSNIATTSYVQSQNTILSSVVLSPLTLTTSIAPLQSGLSTSSNDAATSYVQSQNTTLSSIVTSWFTPTTSIAPSKSTLSSIPALHHLLPGKVIPSPIESCDASYQFAIQRKRNNSSQPSTVQSHKTNTTSDVPSGLKPTRRIAPMPSGPSTTPELHLFPGQVMLSPIESLDTSCNFTKQQNGKESLQLIQENKAYSLPSSTTSNVATSSFVQLQMTNITSVVSSGLKPNTSIASLQSGPSTTALQVTPSPIESRDASCNFTKQQNGKESLQLLQENKTHSLPSSTSSNVATSSFVQSQITNTTSVVPSGLTPTTSIAPLQSSPSTTSGQVKPSPIESREASCKFTNQQNGKESSQPSQENSTHLLPSTTSSNVATSSFVQSQITTPTSVVSSQLTPTKSIVPLQSGPSQSPKENVPHSSVSSLPSNVVASSYVQSQNTPPTSVVPLESATSASIVPLQSASTQSKFTSTADIGSSPIPNPVVSLPLQPSSTDVSDTTKVGHVSTQIWSENFENDENSMEIIEPSYAARKFGLTEELGSGREMDKDHPVPKVRRL